MRPGNGAASIRTFTVENRAILPSWGCPFGLYSAVKSSYASLTGLKVQPIKLVIMLVKLEMSWSTRMAKLVITLFKLDMSWSNRMAKLVITLFKLDMSWSTRMAKLVIMLFKLDMSWATS